MAGQSITPSAPQLIAVSQTLRACGLAVLWLLAAEASIARADDDVQQVLRQWVSAATSIEPPSLATAQARFGRELSAHQLQTAISLWAPASVESLSSQFDWIISPPTANGIDSIDLILTGTPRNDVDQAFIGEVVVHWNRETHRPTQIVFGGNSRPVTFATLRRPSLGVIQQAAFYPPDGTESPLNRSNDNSEVRTASATVDSVGSRSATDTVATLLDRWAAASATPLAWELRLKAFEINHVFATEQQYYVTMRGDGAGTIEICWDPVLSGTDASDTERTTAEGTPYTLQDGFAHNWVFTPDEALFADLRTQTARRMPLSDFDYFPWHKHPLRGPSCVNFNLPVDADELNARYRWEVVAHDEQRWHLRGVPAHEGVSQSIGVVDIILNATTCLPEEIRCLEAGGSHEHVLQLIERAVPIGLTRDVILEGYSHFAPAFEKPGASR